MLQELLSKLFLIKGKVMFQQYPRTKRNIKSGRLHACRKTPWKDQSDA